MAEARLISVGSDKTILWKVRCYLSIETPNKPTLTYAPSIFFLAAADIGTTDRLIITRRHIIKLATYDGLQSDFAVLQPHNRPSTLNDSTVVLRWKTEPDQVWQRIIVSRVHTYYLRHSTTIVPNFQVNPESLYLQVWKTSGLVR